ncbi:hypothetical protein L596_019824 [Steinernema carpocapsae]|uniref:Uncharacterized protein n=1 Tax=Steinernema carpocapsae TaxID=34508 RepID=A0A4U5MRU7_STECR|nr:hypothetical protein L596_019824 [Steinernema carpocapsae]
MDPSTVGTGIPNRSKMINGSIYSWNRDIQSVQDRSMDPSTVGTGIPNRSKIDQWIHLQLEPGYPIGPRSIKDLSTVGTGIPNRSKIDQRSIYSWNRDTQSVQDDQWIHLQLEPGYPIGPRLINDPSTVGTGIPNRSKIDQRSIYSWNRDTQSVQDRSKIHPQLEPGYPIGPRSIKDLSTVGTGIPNRSKIDQRSIYSWNRDTQSVQD